VLNQIEVEATISSIYGNSVSAAPWSHTLSTDSLNVRYTDACQFDTLSVDAGSDYLNYLLDQDISVVRTPEWEFVSNTYLACEYETTCLIDGYPCSSFQGFNLD